MDFAKVVDKNLDLIKDVYKTTIRLYEDFPILKTGIRIRQCNIISPKLFIYSPNIVKEWAVM